MRILILFTALVFSYMTIILMIRDLLINIRQTKYSIKFMEYIAFIYFVITSILWVVYIEVL